MDLFGILIGRRLANPEGKARKITALEGFPAMGLDGLRSAAYGPEAALTILIPLGAAGLGAIRPIMPEVTAIHLTKLEGPDGEEHLGRLRRQWRDDVDRPLRNAGLRPPELVISPSPHRSFVGRLLKHVAEIEALHPDRSIAVVIPEMVKEHWWDYLLLDSSRARRLRAALLRHGGAKLAVVIVPWAREEPHPEEVIEKEEPQSDRRAATAPQPAQ